MGFFSSVAKERGVLFLYYRLGKNEGDDSAVKYILSRVADDDVDDVFGEDIEQAFASLAEVTDYLHCKNYRHVNGQVEIASLFEGELDAPSLMKRFSHDIQINLGGEGNFLSAKVLKIGRAHV